MKVLFSHIRSFWIIALLAISGIVSLVDASIIVDLHYDSLWHVRPSVAYDGDRLPAWDYDSGPALLARERENRIERANTTFSTFAEFLAAEETVPKIFCFPAGTLVLMANGSRKAIEEIQQGDEVLAGDPVDGEKPSARRVTQLHANWTERLIHISVDADHDGVVDGEIKSTGEHPIWTQNRGWVYAKDLRVGDQLLDPNGNHPSVMAIFSEPAKVATFNLSVQATHTFYVLAGSTPILVHNTSPGDRLYIVYQAPTADGSLYTGRASMGGSFGALTPEQVLEYRFGGGHHRGIDFSQTTIREAIWGGGRGSGAYDATRGAEELYYQRAVQAGVAADQIAPLSASNPNAARYLETAREMGATPCP